MAKQNCKYCGKEVGFASQIKLIDGTFICKDCYKKTGHVFHNMSFGYDTFEKLMREQERNDQIYTTILKGQKKSECFGVESAWYLFCYADSGLMYFKKELGGFVGLGAEKIYNIYRYADLASYDLVDGNAAIDHRMEKGKEYVHLIFNGDYAVNDVYMPANQKMYRELSKYFDECFGLAPTKKMGGLLGGFTRTKKDKSDIAAAASIAGGLKGMIGGGDKTQAMGNIIAGTKLALEGDRTEWIAKTERVLSSAGIEWYV